ncbi:MAG TPA: hypothetical protein VIN03_12075 [Roseateles sp.]
MRNYLSPEKQSRIVSMLTEDGMPVRRIIEAIGCNPANARTTVVNLAAQGRIFTVRTSTDEAPRSEVWCFPTPEARDRFKESRALASRERIRDYHREQAAKRKAERHASGRARNARSMAAEEREARRAQERALRAAEAEIAKQRARLDREAAAAQKQRDKAEARSQQKALKAMTKAAGATIFKTGTKSPKPAAPRFADLPVHNPNNIKPVELPCRLRDRFAPGPDVCSVVNSEQARPWAMAATA